MASRESGLDYDQLVSGRTIFSYVGGNPLIYLDAFGLKVDWPCFGLCAAGKFITGNALGAVVNQRGWGAYRKVRREHKNANDTLPEIGLGIAATGIVAAIAIAGMAATPVGQAISLGLAIQYCYSHCDFPEGCQVTWTQRTVGWIPVIGGLVVGQH